MCFARFCSAEHDCSAISSAHASAHSCGGFCFPGNEVSWKPKKDASLLTSFRFPRCSLSLHISFLSMKRYSFPAKHIPKETSRRTPLYFLPLSFDMTIYFVLFAEKLIHLFSFLIYALTPATKLRLPLFYTTSGQNTSPILLQRRNLLPPAPPPV